MGWILRERRGPKWKRSWTERILHSTFETPLPLIVLLLVTVLLVSTSYYLDYKAVLQQAILNFQLFLVLSTVILILLMHWATVTPDPRPVHNSQQQRGDGSPWGVAAVVVFVLLLVSYQSSLQSKWCKLL